METNKILLGNCLEIMKGFPDNTFDSIVTDPPYGLSFMGKKWDYDVPSVEIWKECLRILKPGGYLLSFAGTRTQHRMACRIEDAGFEIRDMIAWVYGSGFPKSLNIGKAVDKLQGNEREVVGYDKRSQNGVSEGWDRPWKLKQRENNDFTFELTKGNSEWEGWGTALKPALEPVTVARKPLSEKTVAENVLKWGTGGINIDECRIGIDIIPEYKRGDAVNTNFGSGGITKEHIGRFPANLIHDGSKEVTKLFPETESRFFYCAKTNSDERNIGCDNLEQKQIDECRKEGNVGGDNPRNRGVNKKSNFHPTVKPVALMEYLVKLVTPKNGLVLDPFCGSGSTLIACRNLSRPFIGIELNPEYVEIANARLKVFMQQKKLVGDF